MSRILVCPAAHAEAVATEWEPSHVVALSSPTRPGNSSAPHAEVADEVGPRSTHLRCASFEARLCRAPQDEGPRSRQPVLTHRLDLRLHDIAEPRPGLVAPSRADVASLLAFGESWDGSRPLLVHCRMGISRSTAAALILAAGARPRLDEVALSAALRLAAPCATPNPLMIALADELLGRSGRLVAAVREIGRGADYAPYRMFALDLPATA